MNDTDQDKTSLPLALGFCSGGATLMSVRRTGHEAEALTLLGSGVRLPLERGDGPPFQCHAARFVHGAYLTALGGGVVADRVRSWSVLDGRLLAEVELGTEHQFAFHPTEVALATLRDGWVLDVDLRDGKALPIARVPSNFEVATPVRLAHSLLLFSHTGDYVELDAGSRSGGPSRPPMGGGRLSEAGVTPSEYGSFDLGAWAVSREGDAVAISVLGSDRVAWRDGEGAWHEVACQTPEVRDLCFGAASWLVAGDVSGRIWQVDRKRASCAVASAGRPYCLTPDGLSIAWYDQSSRALKLQRLERCVPEV